MRHSCGMHTSMVGEARTRSTHSQRRTRCFHAACPTPDDIQVPHVYQGRMCNEATHALRPHTYQLGLRRKLVLGAHAAQEREVDGVPLSPATAGTNFMLCGTAHRPDCRQLAGVCEITRMHTSTPPHARHPTHPHSHAPTLAHTHTRTHPTRMHTHTPRTHTCTHTHMHTRAPMTWERPGQKRAVRACN